MLPSGTRLGPNEIAEPQGAGGMGAVYRARDTRLGRDVAPKILRAEMAQDAARRDRFEQKPRAAGALNHPNILTVHDFGMHEGHPCLVMELVDGESLRALLDRGPLPLRKLLELAAQAADGLAAAHAAHVTRRDLKPENIMVTREGRAKILEFGLAPEEKSEVVFSVDAAKSAVHDIGRLAPEYKPASSLNPGNRFSLSPDGKSIAYSAGSARNDLWLLEGFAR